MQQSPLTPPSSTQQTLPELPGTAVQWRSVPTLDMQEQPRCSPGICGQQPRRGPRAPHPAEAPRPPWAPPAPRGARARALPAGSPGSASGSPDPASDGGVRDPGRRRGRALGAAALTRGAPRGKLRDRGEGRGALSRVVSGGGLTFLLSAAAKPLLSPLTEDERPGPRCSCCGDITSMQPRAAARTMDRARRAGHAPRARDTPSTRPRGTRPPRPRPPRPGPALC